MVIFLCSTDQCFPDELGGSSTIDGASTWRISLCKNSLILRPVIIANCLLVLNGFPGIFQVLLSVNTWKGTGNASELMTTCCINRRSAVLGNIVTKFCSDHDRNHLYCGSWNHLFP